MSTVLLIHCDGSEGSTSFTDEVGHTVIGQNGAFITTAISGAFGGACANLTGTKSFYLDDSADWTLAADYTIEIRAYWSADPGAEACIVDLAGTGYSNISLYRRASGFLSFFSNGAHRITGATTVSTGAWHHIALSRSSGTVRLFLDGVLQGSFANSTTINPTSVAAGAYAFSADRVSGYVEEFRILKDEGVYTANFTPPSSAFTITNIATLTLTGIPSGEAFGAMVVSGQYPSVTLTGITSAEAFGTLVVTRRVDVSLTESAAATDPTSAVATLYDAIRETLFAAADCNESAQHFLSVAEAGAAIDAMIGGKLFQDALTEVANGGVSTLVEIALRMVERAAASDTAQTAWHTAMTVAETATALDLLAAGWAFHAIETADANDAATGFVTMLATLLEQAIATDTPANSLTLTVTATETADGADAVATLAHLFESLDESAAAAVTIRLGDDVYTGWALNTEDGAVSEFQRYEFNSFCQLQGEYYAAGTDGIYRIGGASDAGEAIVGYLKTGLLDFGSSMQKRMDSAWLAIATDGTVRLKVVTTDGGEAAETWYQVASKDEGAVAENLRLKIGKGLKSRHWQFELVVEDASEFELEEMQFVPMILSRRNNRNY